MKHTAILLTTLGLLLGSLHAQTVPALISYQGRVTDSSGVGLGTGTPVNRKVIFRIYDAATAGNRLWTEEQTTTMANGEFSILLGNGIAPTGTAAGESRPALDTIFTSGTTDRYIEITVDNGDNTINASDLPIAPRQRITSTAYTLRARSAESIATGTDLQLNGSADYGLGWYGTGRLFNGISVNGPVLYGQAGGALGSAVGATKQIALSWDGSRNVSVGAGLTAGGAITGASLNVGAGNINGGNITGTGTVSGASLSTAGVVTAGGATMGAGGFAAPGANTVLQVTGGISGGSLNVNTGSITGGATSVSTLVTSGSVGVGGTPGGGYALDVIGIVRTKQNAGATTGQTTFGYDGLYTAGVVLAMDKVGVGTTTPAEKLDVIGNIKATGTLNVGAITGASLGLGGGSITTTGTLSAGAATVSSLNAGSGNIVTTGSMGVGIASPTRGKLEVVGNAATFDAGAAYYAMDQGGQQLYTSQSDIPASIFADDNIIAKSFKAVSDERIKVILGVSDGAADLNTLQDIQITDYSMKDKVAKGSARYKKVIAQQVETVFPQAVSRITDVVPDIYTKASVKDGWVSLETDLKKGDRVRLIAEKAEGIHEVLEVAEGRFRTAFQPEGKDIFVYGREVEDFRVVDYEAISMLNVSATQQLKKEKDSDVKALQAENAELRARLAKFEAKDKARDAKLAAIEALLSGAKPAVQAVSLQKNQGAE